MGKFLLGGLLTATAVMLAYPWMAANPRTKRAMRCYCRKSKQMMRTML